MIKFAPPAYFQLLQCGDLETEIITSFLVWHMVVYFFLMEQSLASADGYKCKTYPRFTHYVRSLNNLEEEDNSNQTNKRTHFFRYIRDSLVKHFKQWNKSLLFLTILSDQPTTTFFSRLIMGQIIFDESMIHYKCAYHKQNVNPFTFTHFLRNYCSIKTLIETHTP